MKWYWKVLVSIVVFFITLIFSADYVASVFIENEVKIIQDELKGHYNFEYSNLSVSLIQKRVSLKGFKFETVLDSVNTNNKLDFELKKLIINFNSYREVINEGKLHIKQLVLKNPSISYGLKKKLHKDNVEEGAFDTEPEKKEVIEIKEENNKLLKIVVLDNFKLIKGKAEIFHLDEPENDVLKIEQTDVLIEGLTIDLRAKSIDRMLKNEKFILSLKKISTDELKDQTLTIGQVDYTSTTKEVIISDFHLENIVGPIKNAAKKKYRAPWLNINASTIKVKMNPWHLYKKGVIYFKKVEIDGVVAEIYNDVTLELTSSHKPMPSRAIRNITLPFKVDSVKITNSDLLYKHKGKAENPGIFKLSSIDISATNITNINYVIENKPNLVLDINAKLWDEGNLKSKIIIDLKSKSDIVYAMGSVSSMSMNKAENMIKPLYGVEISSGYIKRLNYDFIMNENIGKGKLNFDYKDLKVDIKKVDNEKNRESNGGIKSNKFFNFIANGAVISNNIPGAEGYIPSGVMIFDRTKNKPIFDLYWNCVQVGIMDIVIPDILYKAELNYLKKEKKQEKQAAKTETKKDKKKWWKKK